VLGFVNMPVYGALVGDSDTDGEKDFKQAGFPAIAFICCVLMQALSLYSGMVRGSNMDRDWRTQMGGQKGLTGCAVYLNFTALFLIFGPGSGAQGGASANIIGVMLWFVVCLLYFVILSDDPYAHYAFLVFGSFVELALLGGVSLFGFGEPITDLSSSKCNSYFQAGQDTIKRCDDKGYIQLLRTLGLFAIFVLFIALSNAFLNAPFTRNRSMRGLDESLLSGSTATGGGSSSSASKDHHPTATSVPSSFPYQYESMSSITNTVGSGPTHTNRSPRGATAVGGGVEPIADVTP